MRKCCLSVHTFYLYFAVILIISLQKMFGHILNDLHLKNIAAYIYVALLGRWGSAECEAVFAPMYNEGTNSSFQMTLKSHLQVEKGFKQCFKNIFKVLV